MKLDNKHPTRESWLQAATNELRPYFEKLGYNLPDKIRFAIAWYSKSSGVNIAAIRSSFSTPIPCSPVTEPPSSKHR